TRSNGGSSCCLTEPRVPPAEADEMTGAGRDLQIAPRSLFFLTHSLLTQRADDLATPEERPAPPPRPSGDDRRKTRVPAGGARAEPGARMPPAPRRAPPRRSPPGTSSVARPGSG